MSDAAYGDAASDRRALTGLTWRDLARSNPEFVQWAVQRHGGLPDGPVRRSDYERLAAEYQREQR